MDGNRRKARLLGDQRLSVLERLAAIDLMPRQHLDDCLHRLVDLTSCFALTEQEVRTAPVCPHCGFKPGGKSDIPAEAALNALDDELDALTDAWTRTLLANLDDPTAKESLKLLEPEATKLVAEFIRAGKLPNEVTDSFVQGLQDALSGLEKVSVTTENLRAALLSGGCPATPEENKAALRGLCGRVGEGQGAGQGADCGGVTA